MRLPRERRLLRKVDFEAAYARGRRYGDALFGVHALRRGETHTDAQVKGDAQSDTAARIGLSVGLKAAGSGVQRNRIRRVIRESFRLAQHRLGAFDIVVTARGGVRDATNAALRASLEAIWRKLS